ncbi:hypothetical protein J6590_001423 [Homalodisca vitripennis]|nr:hypothetical protein J6590_001423 [Homalodisca vitripennis]
MSAVAVTFFKLERIYFGMVWYSLSLNTGKCLFITFNRNISPYLCVFTIGDAICKRTPEAYRKRSKLFPPPGCQPEQDNVMSLQVVSTNYARDSPLLSIEEWPNSISENWTSSM